MLLECVCVCVLSCLLQSPRGRLFPGSSARTHSSQLAKMCVCLCVCMWLVCLCKSEASVDGWRMNSSAPLLMFWVVPRSVAHGQKDTMLLHASVSGGGGRVLWERGMNPPTNPSGHECPLDAERDQSPLYCFSGRSM